MKEEEEEEALPAPGGSERGSRRPKMAAAAGDVCGSPAGAQPGAAAEARFISSAKVRPARGASCLPPVPQLSSFGPLSPPVPPQPCRIPVGKGGEAPAPPQGGGSPPRRARVGSVLG